MGPRALKRDLGFRLAWELVGCSLSQQVGSTSFAVPRVTVSSGDLATRSLEKG